MTKSRGILPSRKRWTSCQLTVLRREYPHRQTKFIARRVGHSLTSTYGRAQAEGLRKSAAFLAGEASGRLRKGGLIGSASRFRKGNVPWTKGLKGYRPGGRAIATQFQKGSKPHNWVPIGSERISKDGIRYRKMTDTGYPPRDWKSVHGLLWEKTHGPIPAGHIVVFKDRNREHIELSNLELLTFEVNMQRNSYHNRYPKEIGCLIQLRGALMRQINRRERKREEQDR